MTLRNAKCIIFFLTFPQICELKLVGRNWRDLIATSKAIRRARILAPGPSITRYDDWFLRYLDTHALKDDINFQLLATWPTPNYTDANWPRLNPLFHQVHAELDQGDRDWGPSYDLTIMLPSSDMLTRGDRNGNDYATEPPCKAMAIGTTSWNRDEQQWVTPDFDYYNICWAWNPEGLTVKDVLEVRDALLNTQMGFIKMSDADDEFNVQEAGEMCVCLTVKSEVREGDGKRVKMGDTSRECCRGIEGRVIDMDWSWRWRRGGMVLWSGRRRVEVELRMGIGCLGWSERGTHTRSVCLWRSMMIEKDTSLCGLLHCSHRSPNPCHVSSITVDIPTHIPTLIRQAHLHGLAAAKPLARLQFTAKLYGRLDQHEHRNKHIADQHKLTSTMSAAQQVFDTYELLEMIICHTEQHQAGSVSRCIGHMLTRLQIRELKLVGANWRHIISTSKAVQRARVVKMYTTFAPFKGIDLNSLSRWLLHATTFAYASCRGVTPWYSALSWLRINPIFEHVSAQGRTDSKSRSKLRIKITIPEDTASNYLAASAQFATEPPCNAIQVATHHFDTSLNRWSHPRESTVCLAYNKDGVKVGDILAVRDMVHTTHMRVNRVRDPGDYGITAILSVRGVDPRTASVAERARSARYFDLLPRFRRVSHQPGRELRIANEKDLASVWKPGKK